LSWLIIGVILVAAFGPIFWMVPSASDRRLAKMRARARTHGVQIEMTQLDDLNAEASARVTAGGVRRDPKVSVAAYRLALRRLARAAPRWKILRRPAANDGPLPDWQWETAPSGDADYWKQVANVVSQLPSDALALAADASEVSCWWRERVSAQDAVGSVDHLYELLRKLSEIQTLADESAAAAETAEDAAEPPSKRH